MRLIDFLENYAAEDIAPFHMPGHKRSKAYDYLRRLGADIDITEVTGADNLHDAGGILRECMQRAARLWHSGRSFFLVNGSTCGNLAGIRAATEFGGDIILARNCHRSVYNAVELCGLNPAYIYPEKLNDFDAYGSITPAQVSAALKKTPSARLVILTSPTYEGVISDIAGICAVAHGYGAAVMVDEAHGSHLDLSPYFTGGAVRAGADIVVQSLHKTLPSLTQTAVIHVNGDIIRAESVAAQLSVFETSSPSYPLMASIDGCVSLLADEKKRAELFNTWSNNVDNIYNLLTEMKRFQLLTASYAPEMYGFDKSKIVISTQGSGMSGNVLFSKLYEQGVECEMAAPDYVIAMTGMTDSAENLSRLTDAVLSADKGCRAQRESNGVVHISQKAETRLSPLTAVMQKKREISLKKAVGEVGAEYIWAYPPGIPLVVPGEVITEGIVSELEYYCRRGTELHRTHGGKADSIEIVSGY